MTLSSNDTIDMVPFFELSKGDSIPKTIHRQKPEFIANTNAVILFSTVNDNRSKLKTTGVTDQANYYFYKDPITYLYVSIRNDKITIFLDGDDIKNIEKNKYEKNCYFIDFAVIFQSRPIATKQS